MRRVPRAMDGGYASFGWLMPRSRAAGDLMASTIQSEVELEHVHCRLAEEPERATACVLVDQLEHPRTVEAPGLGDPICLETGVLRRDVRVETRPGRGQRVDRRLGVVRLSVGVPARVARGQELLVQRPEI